MAIQSKSREKLLVLKDKVSKEATTGLTVVGADMLATAVASVPVYNEAGDLLGYMALYDTATLT